MGVARVATAVASRRTNRMHPTRAALLQAVVREPADDLPRKAFADWSEEHGDPKRADLIRTQLELSSWGVEPRAYGNWYVDCRKLGGGNDTECNPPRVGDKWAPCEFHALRWRETMLIEEHGFGFCDDFVSVPGPGPGRKIAGVRKVVTKVEFVLRGPPDATFTVEFRRGFIERVECIPQQWAFGDVARRIVAANPVQELAWSRGADWLPWCEALPWCRAYGPPGSCRCENFNAALEWARM
jgi:uncharacterized protein (TIGR02996 family)